MKSYGNKNPNLTFGILEIRDGEFDGFGAIAKVVLEALIIMDGKGLIPYIDIKSFCYTEKNKVNGTFNAFEYFFKQPCDVVLNRHVPRSEILQSANVEFIQESEVKGILYGYVEKHGHYSIYSNQKFLNDAADVLKKYIRINSFSENVYGEIRGILQGWEDMIGIHVRRANIKEGFSLHSVAVEPYEHLELLKKIRGSRKAFLATDDEEVLSVFGEEYKKGNVRWYHDVLRTPEQYSSKNISVYCCEDKRRNHKYRLGYEILKEILTLSYCGSLIAGFSNVNLIATIIKMSRGENYKEYLIIDKGSFGSGEGIGVEFHRDKVKAINRGIFSQEE